MSDMPLDTKGKRPAFFNDEALDAMMTALLETMAENWTLRERLYALEKTLTENNLISEDAIENITWTDAEKMDHAVYRALCPPVGNRQELRPPCLKKFNC